MERVNNIQANISKYSIAKKNNIKNRMTTEAHNEENKRQQSDINAAQRII